MKRGALILVLAVAAALVSAELYQRKAGPVRYEGVEPGWSYTYVLAGGWPLPFIYDSLYVSPVDKVSLSGVLFTNDKFHFWPFVADVAVFVGLFGGGMWLWRRWSRRHGRVSLS
jgi:hypothetical protein